MNPARSHGQKNITTIKKIKIINYNQLGYGKIYIPVSYF